MWIEDSELDELKAFKVQYAHEGKILVDMNEVYRMGRRFESGCSVVKLLKREHLPFVLYD